MTQFDATARINVDMSGFARAASQSTSAGGAFTASIRSLQTAMTQFEGVDKRTATRLQNELNLYKTLATTVSSYANAITKLGDVNTRASTNQRRLNTAIEAMGQTLQKVTGLSKQDFEAKSRELRLYQQLASAVSTYVNAIAKMASVQQRSAQLSQQQAASDEKLRIAREKLALDTAKLELQQQKLAQQQQRLVQQQQTLATSSQRTGQALQQSSQGALNLSSSSFALRNTLGELESTFQSLFSVITKIPVAMAQAAISQEAAFAQVTRVVGKTDAAAAGLLERFQDIAQTAPISFEEVARIGQLGAQIGITAKQLGNFTDTIVKFSITTGVSADESAILLGRIAEMQNVPIEEMENLGSAILALGTASAATDQEIIRVNESIATVSNIFGLTTQATSGLAAALATLRVRPELSRGSLTRVFGELRDAVEQGGDQLTRLSEVMGKTNEEVVRLFQASPDEFFLAFVKGLSDAAANGESFRSVLADLGINAVRDIDTISRLGNNYDVLAESMDTAFIEYAKGTELQRQSKGIYETTQNEVQNLVDTFKNFLATAGGPLAKAVGTIASALSSVVGFITDLGPIIPILGGVAAAVAVSAAAWAGLQVVMAKTVTNIIAMRELQKNLGVSTINLNTVLRVWRGEQTTAGAATTALNNSMRNLSATATGLSGTMTPLARNSAIISTEFLNASRSATALAGAGRGLNQQLAFTNVEIQGLNRSTSLAVPALNGMSASMVRAAEAGAAMGAGMGSAARSSAVAAGAFTTAGTAATGASIGMRALTLATGPWGLALAGVALVLGPLLFDMDLYKTKAEKLAEASIEAAGGSKALAAAIAADTKAGKENNTVYREVTATKKNVSDEDRKAAEQVKRTAQARIEEITTLRGSVEQLKAQASGHDTAAKTARKYLQEIDSANKSIEKANQVTAENVVLVGDQARAWVDNAAAAAISESGIAKNEKALARLKETGIDIGAVLTRAIEDPQGATAELEKGINSLNREATQLTQWKGIDAETRKSLTDSKDAAKGAQDVLTALKKITEETGDEATAAAVKQELLGKAMDSLGAKSEAVGGKVKLTKDNLEDLDTTAEEAQSAIDDLAKTMSGFGTFATAFESAATKAAGGVKSSTDEAVKAVDNFSLKSKKGFEAYLTELEAIAKAQREWATNLVKISATLGPEIAEEFRKAGPDAAKAVSEIANLSSEELAKLKPRLEAIMGQNVSGLSASIIKGGEPLKNATKQTSDLIANTLSAELGSAKNTEQFNAVIERYGVLLQNLKNHKGEVNIDNVKGLKSIQDIINYIKLSEDQRLFDPDGRAELKTELFRRGALDLLSLVIRMEQQGAFDPEGTADVETNMFRNKILESERLKNQTQNRGGFSPKGTASVDTAAFNSNLRTIEANSAGTGRRVRSNLSVYANAFLTVSSNIRKILGFADGGWVTGRGGPREDNIPVAASSGEFIVNAKSAERFGPLLEAINNQGGGGGANEAIQAASRRMGAMPFESSQPAPPQQGLPKVVAQVPDDARALTQSAPGVQGPRTVINVVNHYPQAEPTSKTVNRTLAFAANLDGTS